jgi:hypothetical protein
LPIFFGKTWLVMSTGHSNGEFLFRTTAEDCIARERNRSHDRLQFSFREDLASLAQ